MERYPRESIRCLSTDHCDEAVQLNNVLPTLKEKGSSWWQQWALAKHGYQPANEAGSQAGKSTYMLHGVLQKRWSLAS